MYKYFMGKDSNYNSRNENTPIVIAVDELSNIEIDKWLDRYLLDFDIMIERLKSVLKGEIIKINFIDKDYYVCFLENGKTIFLNLLYESEPKCIVHIDNDEFVINFVSEVFLESCCEQIEKFKVGLKNSLYKKEIFMGNEKTMISINILDDYEELYPSIKENIDKLNNWNSIPIILYWLYSFCYKAFTFTLTITSIDCEKFESEKIEVEKDKVLEYGITEDDIGYSVEIDGSWYAKSNEILAKYDSYSREKYIMVLPSQEDNSLFATKFILSMNKQIELLMKILKKLNDLVERLVYLH